MKPVTVTVPALALVALCLSAPSWGGPAASAAPSLGLRSAVPQVAPPGWEPLAYGDAQVSTPAAWPVVYPGSEVCGPAASGGVVLLGSFGSSSWCGPHMAAPAGQSAPANLVRLGPLPPARTRTALR